MRLTPVCLIAACLLSSAVFTEAAAAPSEERAVIDTFQAFLNGLGHRDKAAMSATLVPGGSATFMRNGKPVQLSFDVMTDKLSQPGTETREERTRDVLVRIDGDIAVLWAPFEFYLAGKIDHCGTDVATFAKSEGRWLISFIGDNHRTECKAH
jgi:hypothetical protein